MRMMLANQGITATSVFRTMKSPLGKLKLAGSDRGLAAVLWEDDAPDRVRSNVVEEEDSNPLLVETERQLNEYFLGQRKRFSIELDFAGTAFQRCVWSALLTIPFGETRSYGEIATQIGNPKAVRAVGAASGKNPISIVAPCHRVIGATGALTGFAGGLKVKEYLLELERGGAASDGRLSLFSDQSPPRAAPAS